jgi:hypothetical protein
MSQGSSAPHTFPHETVLGRARELLALCAHRLWQAGIPFAFFDETVERSASQRPTVLADRFARARCLRHCRSDRQGRNNGSKKNWFHGSQVMFQASRLWSKSATAD